MFPAFTIFSVFILTLVPILSNLPSDKALHTIIINKDYNNVQLNSKQRVKNKIKIKKTIINYKAIISLLYAALKRQKTVHIRLEEFVLEQIITCSRRRPKFESEMSEMFTHHLYHFLFFINYKHVAH